MRACREGLKYLDIVCLFAVFLIAAVLIVRFSLFSKESDLIPSGTTQNRLE